ncbi:Crossover junction endodeoxyribonuclease RuvC [hydrothermal vent metagenome]|uniref:Crossover junction endodeoxyribonuclease RuvC n=1 Tax=hydrothermal vent metagenome TaxID=652676 RepID=A0A1W1BEZ7_9ZZZZ
MFILGIDPGSRNLGYCVLCINKNRSYRLIEAGVIKIKSLTIQEQLLELLDGLNIIIKSHKIDEVAIEDIFFAHNPKSVLKLAQFRGAISLKIVEDIGYFYEYTPLQVKKAITGNGKATKEQVSFMVRRLLGIKKEIKPLDITDAMAIAITHSQRVNIRKNHINIPS